LQNEQLAQYYQWLVKSDNMIQMISGPAVRTSKKMLHCFLFSAVLLTALNSCKKDNTYNNEEYVKIQPKGPKPSWGPTITPQMQTVIETLDTIAPVPIYTLTPAQARQQPSAADAAMRVMRNFGIPTPLMNVDTEGRDIPVQGGQIHLRLYTPKSGKMSYPVVVYYHGGGWVIATIDTYNVSAQALAEQTDAIVVSVEYRKGPEFKFPTAHNDAFAAYKWSIKNASTFKGDSTKIAVAGESAGGNLAVTVSMMARDSGVRKPLHEVAVYPVASGDPATPSKLQYVNAKPLGTPALPWFLGYYLKNPAEATSPLISLVNANLAVLPPATIIAAEIDPLQSEGKQLADKLQAAGVSTTYKLYVGVTHEFFGMAAVVPEAKEAQALAASQLKNAFK
jgi:acetyl esterase/lipase